MLGACLLTSIKKQCYVVAPVGDFLRDCNFFIMYYVFFMFYQNKKYNTYALCG